METDKFAKCGGWGMPFGENLVRHFFPNPSAPSACGKAGFFTGRLCTTDEALYKCPDCAALIKGGRTTCPR